MFKPHGYQFTTGCHTIKPCLPCGRVLLGHPLSCCRSASIRPAKTLPQPDILACGNQPIGSRIAQHRPELAQELTLGCAFAGDHRGATDRHQQPCWQRQRPELRATIVCQRLLSAPSASSKCLYLDRCPLISRPEAGSDNYAFHPLLPARNSPAHVSPSLLLTVPAGSVLCDGPTVVRVSVNQWQRPRSRRATTLSARPGWQR